MCSVTVMCVPVTTNTTSNGTEAETTLYGKFSSDNNSESVWMFYVNSQRISLHI